MPRVSQPDRWRLSLNESPSEKEGKFRDTEPVQPL